MAKNLSNQVFGRLTVKHVVGQTRNKTNVWLCICDCGKESHVNTNNLVQGTTRSCGCLGIENRQNLKELSTTHGMTGTRTYKSWEKMLGRCFCKTDKKYPDYGARGITVSESWMTFENFFSDMGEAPENHTLDRIDVNGNYCKENCRWADATTQARNRRNSTIVEFGGKKQHLKVWAVELGVDYYTLYARIFRNKWPLDKAFQK